MKKYQDLLPSYLGGENIRLLSEVCEAQDNNLYYDLLLLSLMFKLERPILIEKKQEEPATCTVRVYVNTENPIRKVMVTGDCTLVQEYDEDDLVVQETYTFTATSEYPLVAPSLTVNVETYEGEVYTKAYPENDKIQGDAGDHDEFLDRVGTLLGIPRRTYIEQPVGQQVSNYLKLYPPFFTKRGYGKRVGDTYTEDDYYYSMRLQKFVKERNNKPLVTLMTEIMYEWDDVQYSNMLNRDTSYTEEMLEYLGQPVVEIINKVKRYTNMDYSNMEDILGAYVPLTRDILCSRGVAHTEQIVYVNSADYFNNVNIHVEVYGYNDDYSEEVLVLNAPIHLYYESSSVPRTYFDTVYSSDEGIVDVSVGGLPAGDCVISGGYEGEYEFPSVPSESMMEEEVCPSDSCDMDLEGGAWKWGQYTKTQVSQYVEPFVDSVGLCVGRRCLCYSPVLNPRLIALDKVIIDIWFRYTKPNSKIGLVRVRDGDDGLIRETGRWFNPNSYFGVEGDLNTIHRLSCEILDGVMVYYIDDQKTGIVADFQTLTKDPIFYVAGYSIYPVSLQQQQGLYITDFKYRNPRNITDNTTTTNNTRTTNNTTEQPTTITKDNKTGINAAYNTYAKTYWKYPLKRGTNASIKFKAYWNTTQSRVSIMLASLKKNGSHHATPIREYNPSWAKWGDKNGGDRKGGSMSTNAWHDIEFRLEDSTLSVYTDNTLQFTEDIGTIDSEDNYFNDYFFLAWARFSSSTTEMIVSGVQYTSDTYISEEERITIYEHHNAQFT